MGRLVMLVVGEMAVAALTQRLARPHWSALRQDPAAVWQASAGDLVVTVLHLAAWLSAWWVLAGTGHDLVAVAVDLRRGRPGRGSRLAPAWVQRVLHRALGTMLLLGVMGGPASAASGAAAAQPVDAVQVVTPPVPIIGLPSPAAGEQAVNVTATTAPPSSPQPDAATDGTADHPAVGAAAVDAEDGTAEQVHVVAAGENLWVIARQQLSAEGQDAPTDREVHAHWLQLIQTNLDLLRSGDPDRIFPGERLRLPVGTTSTMTSPATPVGTSQAGTASDDGGGAR